MGGTALLLIWKRRGKRYRGVGIAAGVVVLIAGVACSVRTPAYYGYPALVDAVMIRIAKTAEAPKYLADFGLSQADLRFAGMDVYRADGPGADAGFQSRFRHNKAKDLLFWYVRHPRLAYSLLADDLLHAAPQLRPLGDIEKQYSPPIRSHSFCWWSDFQSLMLSKMPAITPLVYCLICLCAVATCFLPSWWKYRPLALLGALLVLIGVLQFCSASLLDAVETPRHLLMFHVTTDVLLFGVMTAGLEAFACRVMRRPAR